jgi:predicted Ser/Thr protein kinase
MTDEDPCSTPLFELINAAWTTRAIAVAAELQLAEALHDGPRDVRSLAQVDSSITPARKTSPPFSLNALAPLWPALSGLLDEALALPAHERAALVASLQGEHAALRPVLEQLLGAHAVIETGDFLLTLPALPAAAGTPYDAALAPGRRIGPYGLIREIGRGGMADVWLAEPCEGLERQVALKLPRVAWRPAAIERFARERDILASLEHPNIARLYDAGVDELGRPWLALEYVPGRAIDAHCRAHGATTRERVRMLLQVCDAVAYAHDRLVVHCDLKPSNILVTGDGQVRLIDFGIAKLMQAGRTQDSDLAEATGRALTPDYASPEQLRGDALSTASDVYSLGVIAYELLAGSRPYRLGRGGAAALEAAIAAVDLLPASATASDPALRRELRGDLDAILNKALKPAEAERYPTMDALAQDLRRHAAPWASAARTDRLRG